MGTASVTFSCDVELLVWLEDYAKENRISRSRSIAYLIRMGKVYLQVLNEQTKAMEPQVDQNVKEQA